MVLRFCVLQVELESVYLGPEVNDILAGIPLHLDPNANLTQAQEAAVKKKATDETTFRLKCLDFYTTAAKELRELVPLKDPFFEDLEFLEPQNALSFEYRQHRGDLNRLCNQFKVSAPARIIDDRWCACGHGVSTVTSVAGRSATGAHPVGTGMAHNARHCGRGSQGQARRHAC